MMRRLFQWPWRTRRIIADDVDAEFRYHLDARTEELVARGVPSHEARARVLREFGDLDEARHYIRRVDGHAEAERRRRLFVDDLRQDVVFALRKLRSAPTFAVTAILTLAIGIGANTAIFSFVNGVLLRPLPFPREEQLYQVWSANPSAGLDRAAVSAVDLDDWRAQRSSIADMGGYFYAAGSSGVDYTGAGDPQRLTTVFFSPGFFPTLGALPITGRLPRDDETVRGGDDRVVMLSHAFFQRQFGGAPGVVGSFLTLNGEPYEVLGVLGSDFRFPAPGIDVFIPFSTIPDESIPRIRPVRILEVVARARPGTSELQLTNEMNAITRRMAATYPEDQAWTGATVQPLREAVTGDVRTALFVLLGAVAFVLLIACVNVASLLLARASVREREMAVRIALGAGRGRVVRQLLTESLLLAMIGGLAGLGLAALGRRLLLALSEGQMPRGEEVQLDGTVLLFALGVTLFTGLLFGVVPALRSSAGDVQRTLRTGGRSGAGNASNRLRHGLVIAEVSLAMVLVAGGALMTRSFTRLLQTDPGFRADNLVVFNFTLSSERHPNFLIQYQQILDRVRALPGVEAAGAIKDAPLRGTGERFGFRLPGMVVPAGEEPPLASLLHVSEGFFRAIGTPLVAGREFLLSDADSAPTVVVVNEAFAKAWFPGKRAVGESILLHGSVPSEVVGVVGDIRQASMATPAVPTMYVHEMQNRRVRMNLIVRTRGEPLAMTGAIREAIWSVDRLQPITAIFTFDDVLHEALARPRLLTVLLAAFGVIGLVLGAIGLYGVLAFLVTQRQREIGVRLALGARPRDVLRMIVKHGLTLAMAGVVIGAVGAIALGRFMRGVLYGVTPSDPLVLGVVAVSLTLVAAVASWIPARRAAGVDPVVTLRAE